MKKTINVTRECIKKGIKDNSYYCPIARACKKAGITFYGHYGGAGITFYGHYGGVGIRHIDGYYKKKNFRYKTPKKAQNFIERFDEGKKVNPIKFTINLPDKL